MQANPDKFQVLGVGKKTYEKRPTINIQNFELTCEDSVKLLGIEIDYQLNFDTHISARKAPLLFSINMSYCNPHTQNEELFLALFLSFWNFSPYKNARPKGKS
jgi:hypothetical protein